MNLKFYNLLPLLVSLLVIITGEIAQLGERLTEDLKRVPGSNPENSH